MDVRTYPSLQAHPIGHLPETVLLHMYSYLPLSEVGSLRDADPWFNPSYNAACFYLVRNTSFALFRTLSENIGPVRNNASYWDRVWTKIASGQIPCQETVLFTHRFKKPQNGLAILQDGRIAWGNLDGFIRVKKDDPNDVGLAVHAHKVGVGSLCALSSGCLVSGSFNGELAIWEVSDHQIHLKQKTRSSNCAWIQCIQEFSQEQLIYSDAEGRITLWNYATREQIEFNGHNKHVNCLVTLPGLRFVSGGADTTLRIWHEGKCQHNVGGQGAAVRALSRLQNEVLCGREDGSVQLLTPEEDPKLQVVFEADQVRVSSLLALSYRMFLCANSNGTIPGDGLGVCWLTDLDSRDLNPLVIGGACPVSGMAILPNGFVTGDDEGTIRSWHWELPTAADRPIRDEQDLVPVQEAPSSLDNDGGDPSLMETAEILQQGRKRRKR